MNESPTPGFQHAIEPSSDGRRRSRVPQHRAQAEDSTKPAEDSAKSNEPLAVTQLIEQIRPSVVTIRVNGRDGSELAMGTGFVIDREGLIVTNLHVIPEGRSFSIETPDGRDLKVVSIESTDRAGDLAIIRVQTPTPPLAALPLAEEPIAQGTRVLAFGNPLGLRDSVVTGIVSAVREVEGREMIQLAMPTQPGNSGGPSSIESLEYEESST